MKTPLFFTAALAMSALLSAAEKPQEALCVCCLEVKPAAPLTARSIYQLDAKWTNDANQVVALSAFRGQPVIVAMMFAQCEYACPMLVSDIRRARELLPVEVRAKAKVLLVSFDSARDTPAALKAYRARVGLDANWTLLHGEPAAVQELAMLLGVKYKQDARGQFAHSNLLTVLNAEGEIVHQRAGLQGDMSDFARAVTVAVK